MRWSTPDPVARVGLALRVQERRVHPEVACPVVARAARQLVLHVGEDRRLVEVVEEVERRRHPTDAVLGQHDPQVRVALEHARPDQRPHRAVRPEQRALGRVQHARGARGAVVGLPAAGVHVDREVEVGARGPERLVAVVVVEREVLAVRRDADPGAEAGFLREPCFFDGGVDVVHRHERDARRAVRVLRRRSRRANGCARALRRRAVRARTPPSARCRPIGANGTSLSSVPSGNSTSATMPSSSSSSMRRSDSQSPVRPPARTASAAL